MAYRERQFQNPFGFRITPWVKRLLIANGVVFLVTMSFPQLLGFLAFTPSRLLAVPEPWTPLTYMFAHGGLFHLLFNMLVLFFFGPPLEERWGSSSFIKFYLVAGISGAALSIFFWNTPIIGASGAVYGVMFAYAYYWPNNPIYIWGILPVKAKWLVGFLIGMSVVYLLTGTATGVAHLAHLGGVVGAYAFMKSPWGPGSFGPKPRTPKKRSSRRTDSLRASRPKPTRSAREAEPAGVSSRTTAEERELLEEVDRILDKISKTGLRSLSDEERSRLEEVSKRYRTH